MSHKKELLQSLTSKYLQQLFQKSLLQVWSLLIAEPPSLHLKEVLYQVLLLEVSQCLPQTSQEGRSCQSLLYLEESLNSNPLQISHQTSLLEESSTRIPRDVSLGSHRIRLPQYHLRKEAGESLTLIWSLILLDSLATLLSSLSLHKEGNLKSSFLLRK